MIYFLCSFLLILSLFLTLKLFLLHKSIREISEELNAIQGVHTNALVTISSGDRHIRRLAAQLNRQLSRLRSRQLKYENGDRELKEAITNISHDLRTPLTACPATWSFCKRSCQEAE